MTKYEFEKLIKRTVTDEEYNAIEKLYMASDLDKYEFAKSMIKVVSTIPEKEENKKVVIGVKEMPNGTWLTYEAELININIATGKIEVKRTSMNRCWSETNFDYYYTRVEEIA